VDEGVEETAWKLNLCDDTRGKKDEEESTRYRGSKGVNGMASHGGWEECTTF